MPRIQAVLIALAFTMMAACGGGTYDEMACEALATSRAQAWPTSAQPVNVVAAASFTAPITATYDIDIGGAHSLDATDGSFVLVLYPTITTGAAPAVALSAVPATVHTQSHGSITAAFKASVSLTAGQSVVISIASAAIGVPPHGATIGTSSAYVTLCRAATT